MLNIGRNHDFQHMMYGIQGTHPVFYYEKLLQVVVDSKLTCPQDHLV